MDEDLDWNKISASCFKDESSVKPEGKTIHVEFGKRSNRLFLRIAAAVVAVIFVAATLVYLYVDRDQEIQLVAQNVNLEKVLPDGSQVTLTPGSSIVYQKHFKNDLREVKLVGDAYFDVAHDAKKPFIIHASTQVEVKVLGTQFYINTANASGKIEVVLIEGKVSVYYKDHPEQAITLLPGERTEVAPNPAEMVKEVNPDQNFLSWKTGRIVFKDTRLDEVINVLKKQYKADIRLSDPKLADCTITTTFENQSLDAVLRVIKETLSLNVHKNGKIITISGDPCR
jgi:ferric-dicitrate binding protein FerR (iron transport regulator)